jgi:hypothetical protein
MLADASPPWASTWPFTRPGVCLAYLGPHLVILQGEGADRASFDAFIEELDGVLARVPGDHKGGSIIHIGTNKAWKHLSLGEKSAIFKRWDALFVTHADTLRRSLLFSATICVNSFTRAAVRTVSAFRPSVVPTGVVANGEEAWTAIARVFPELVKDTMLTEHAALCARYVPSLLPSVRRAGRNV